MWRTTIQISVFQPARYRVSMGSGVSVDDKIQFVAPAAALAVDGREHPHDTDINRVVAPNEVVVAEILKKI